MTSAQVKQLVEEEIGGNWTAANLHGVDLRTCLVEPRRVACLNTFPQLNKGKNLDMWIVLEEEPGSNTGYLIVYDDQTTKYGLAAWSGDMPVFLGYHGSFLNTLAGM